MVNYNYLFYDSIIPDHETNGLLFILFKRSRGTPGRMSFGPLGFKTSQLDPVWPQLSAPSIGLRCPSMDLAANFKRLL